MVYVQMSRLNEMFESLGTDTSLQCGMKVSLQCYLAWLGRGAYVS
jgi:hypothetical protein